MEAKPKQKTHAEIERMSARAFDGLDLAAGDDAITELKKG